MISKSFNRIVKKNGLPIPLLFMESMTNENSIADNEIILVCNENGNIQIGHDFYKHISTY